MKYSIPLIVSLVFLASVVTKIISAFLESRVKKLADEDDKRAKIVSSLYDVEMLTANTKSIGVVLWVASIIAAALGMIFNDFNDSVLCLRILFWVVLGYLFFDEFLFWFVPKIQEICRNCKKAK